MPRRLLDLFYLLALVLASPWIVYRLTRTSAWGLVPARFGIGLEPEPRECLWLHGSSVGEVSLLRPLVALFDRDMPDLTLVISSYTQTGLAAARAQYPRHRIIVFPFDFSFIVRRFLSRLKPRAVIIVESELWPNFLAVTGRHGIPIAVINGKMSQKSFAIHKRAHLIAAGLRGVKLLAVQTEEHAQRFAVLGVPREAIRVTGNMKYDLVDPTDSHLRGQLRGELGYGPDETVVIGGSLHPGEDEALLDVPAFAGADTRARLILAPRYPADAEAMCRHVSAAGLAPVRKSELDRGAAALDRGSVLVVDTLGELDRLYAAADIAFVGGSLFYRGANKGGHNLMEPAIRGLPVLFGPYNFSFKETVQELLAAEGGMLVRDGGELRRALDALVTDGGARVRMGRRARDVVLRGQGATERNYALVARLQPQLANRTMPRVARDHRT